MAHEPTFKVPSHSRDSLCFVFGKLFAFSFFLGKCHLKTFNNETNTRAREQEEERETTQK